MLDIFLNLYNQIKPLSTKSERKTEVLFSYSCSNHLNLEKQKSFSVVTRLKKKKRLYFVVIILLQFIRNRVINAFIVKKIS